MSAVDLKKMFWEVLTSEFIRLNLDIKVTVEYPRDLQEIDTKPTVTIARRGDSEGMRAIGDHLGSSPGLQTQGRNAGHFVTHLGQYITETYEIAVWATNSILRDDLFIVTRQILFDQKKYIESNYGVMKFIRVDGRDEEIDSSLLPRTIYRGVLTYEIMTRLMNVIVDDLVTAVIPRIEIIGVNVDI
jgi:hypothetical protein